MIQKAEMGSGLRYWYPRCTCNRFSEEWSVNPIICLACGRGLRGTGEVVTYSIPAPRVCVFIPSSKAPRKRSVIPCPTVSIPTITVNFGHLVNNSHCPICLGQFQIGTQAKEMPCNHIYHSDCIIPWLANNITCPVCRHALPSEQTNSPSAPSRQHVYMHLYIAFLILLQGFWIILIG